MEIDDHTQNSCKWFLKTKRNNKINIEEQADSKIEFIFFSKNKALNFDVAFVHAI